MTKNPREAAFLALLAVHQGEIPSLFQFLEKWRKEMRPQHFDVNLAQEIAYGTERRLLSLDFVARKLSTNEKLPDKMKEKMLLRMAVYQHLFLDKIPPHALVSEMVQLAKKHCHAYFVRFLNAALRKLVAQKWTLPAEQKSVYYSYPEYFIEKIEEQYGPMQGEEILRVLNCPPLLMARKRLDSGLSFKTFSGDEIERLMQDSAYYIQNCTQPTLLVQLAKGKPDAHKILDLCSAPGGKLVFLSELFPKAELFANDISEERLEHLKANLAKYQVSSALSCMPGQDYPKGKKFDLVLVDAPCSNSGVLHKRPEARWRLRSSHLEKLRETQWALIQNAASLLAAGGQLWYMTCSILREENEQQIERACDELSLVVNRGPIQQLPNKEGWDGGFACALTQKENRD